MEPAGAEALVAIWIDAVNRRDVEGVVEPLGPAAEIHPLRMPGVDPVYIGRDGGARWIDDLDRAGDPHRLEVTETQVTPRGRILAVGSVRIAETICGAPFCGLHEVCDGRLAEVTHYFSRSELLVRLGVIQSRREAGSEAAGLV